MKSVVCEASSIGKALEQAWEKAGKPKEFTIEILEEAEKNFLGLTKRMARVALFFEIKPIQKYSSQPTHTHVPRGQAYSQGQKPEQKPVQKTNQNFQASPGRDVQREQVRDKVRTQDHRDERRNTLQHVEKRVEKVERKDVSARSDHREPRQEVKREQVSVPVSSVQEVAVQQQKNVHRRTSQWSPELCITAQEWLNDVLKLMNIQGVSVSIKPSDFLLRVIFSGPLRADSAQERRLFVHLAALLLETIKRTHKIALRGHKVLLERQQSHDTRHSEITEVGTSDDSSVDSDE